MSPTALHDTPAVDRINALKAHSAALPPLAPWVEPAPTKADLPWAELEELHLPDLDSTDPAKRTALLNAARKALVVDGFMFVTGTGVSSETLRRNLAIAQLAISGVPDEEKQAYAAKLDEGSYKGYKLRGIWKKDGGLPDNIEHYNLESSSFDHANAQHPRELVPYLPEIEAFAHHTYHHVVRQILRMVSLALELPEDYLWGLHDHEGVVGAACQRFMGYFPRSEEEEREAQGIWSKGHTDYNTVSLLYSQPVAALQILTPEGEWKWVKHVEGAVVVNTADALDFLTGGVFKATRHRVIRPPSDQANIMRYILIHFARARLDLPLEPIWDSPVVKAKGVHPFQDRIAAGERVPTQEEWLRERIRRTGKELYDEGSKQKDGMVEEAILGRKVEYYV